MKKINVKAIVSALVLVLIIGVVLACVGYAMFEPNKIGTDVKAVKNVDIFDLIDDDKYNKAEKVVTEDGTTFTVDKKNIVEIELDISFSDLEVLPTDSDVFTITSEKSFLDVIVDEAEGQIEITEDEKNNKWFNVNLNTDISNTVVIEVPKSFVGNIEIDNGFGSVDVYDLDVNKLDVTNDFGSIYLKNITAKTEIDCSIDFGDLEIENIFAPNLEFSAEFGTLSGTIDGNEDDFRINKSNDFGSSTLDTKKDGKYMLSTTCAFGSADITFTQN